MYSLQKGSRNMWNPFKSYKIEAIPDTTDIDSKVHVPNGTEQAQLRSLKARTEITMLYETIAEKALNNMRGENHATS